jgi:hypothetical protein
LAQILGQPCEFYVTRRDARLSIRYHARILRIRMIWMILRASAAPQRLSTGVRQVPVGNPDYMYGNAGEQCHLGAGLRARNGIVLGMYGQCGRGRYCHSILSSTVVDRHSLRTHTVISPPSLPSLPLPAKMTVPPTARPMARPSEQRPAAADDGPRLLHLELWPALPRAHPRLPHGAARTGRALRNLAPNSRSTGERYIGDHRKHRCLAQKWPAP